jgi:hypothetical protein
MPEDNTPSVAALSARLGHLVDPVALRRREEERLTRVRAQYDKMLAVLTEHVGHDVTLSGWLTRKIDPATLEGDNFVWAFGGFPVRCDTCAGVSLSEQW